MMESFISDTFLYLSLFCSKIYGIFFFYYIYIYLLFFTIFCFVYFIAPTWRYKSGYRSGERFYCVRGWTQVWWRKGNIYILYVLMPVTQVLVCLFNTIPFELIVEPCHAPCTFNYFFLGEFRKNNSRLDCRQYKGSISNSSSFYHCQSNKAVPFFPSILYFFIISRHLRLVLNMNDINTHRR